MRFPPKPDERLCRILYAGKHEGEEMGIFQLLGQAFERGVTGRLRFSAHGYTDMLSKKRHGSDKYATGAE